MLSEEKKKELAEKFGLDEKTGKVKEENGQRDSRDNLG